MDGERGGERAGEGLLPASTPLERGDLLLSARGERDDKKATRDPSAETE